MAQTRFETERAIEDDITVGSRICQSEIRLTFMLGSHFAALPLIERPLGPYRHPARLVVGYARAPAECSLVFWSVFALYLRRPRDSSVPGPEDRAMRLLHRAAVVDTRCRTLQFTDQRWFGCCDENVKRECNIARRSNEGRSWSRRDFLDGSQCVQGRLRIHPD